MENATPEAGLVLPNDHIKSLVDRLIREDGFVEYDFKLSAGSNKGDNYIGILYKLTVTGTKENGEAGTLNLICKLPPTNPARRKEFKVQQCFKTEVLAYQDIIPKLMKLQEEKGISDGKFEAVAECCAASTEEGEEFIIMKDLREEGYIMFDRFLNIDFDHAKLVMEELGKFHAFSFAMRDQNPEDFEQYKELKDAFFTDMDEQYITYFKLLCDEIVGSLEDHDADVKDKVLQIKNNIDGLMKECVSGKLNEPYSVVTHGDCWNNNMLFKYEHGRPVDLKLLDWQIMRYASPVLDLVYYIFCCTVKSFRDLHYDDLLAAYHNSLSKFLTQFGSDPDVLFPYSVFENQLKKFGKYGFIMALMLVKLITSNAEDTPDLDDIAEQMQENPSQGFEGFDAQYVNTKGIYQSRVVDVVKDILRLGYLE